MKRKREKREESNERKRRNDNNLEQTGDWGSFIILVQGGRGDANAVIKCKLCSRENSIDILPETIARWIEGFRKKL